ncbi:hypothetical protein HAX54_043341, partial [Datura stramonium]|nr:hypothetical protein [Datura stramonium]
TIESKEKEVDVAKKSLKRGRPRKTDARSLIPKQAPQGDLEQSCVGTPHGLTWFNTQKSH